MLEHGPLFESILARSNEGVAAFAHDGALITVNSAFQTMCDVRASTVNGGRVDQVIDHVAKQLNDSAGFRDRMSSARAGEVDESAAELSETKDGRVLEWQVASLLIYGTSYGWVWTVTDVSGRERAAAELGERERRFEQARALAGLGTWEIDAATGEMRWSDDVSELLGVSARGNEPWVDENVRWADPGTAESMRRESERALTDGTAFTRVDRVLIPGGGIRTVRSHGHPLRDESGRVTRLIGTVREADERGDVVVVRAQVLAALDSSPVPTAVIDGAGRIAHANPPFVAVTGCGAGVALHDIVEQESGDDAISVRRLCEEGWRSVERRYRTVDGRWADASINIALMPDEGTGEAIMRLIERVPAPRLEDDQGSDPLTLLPIAPVFDRRVEEALETGQTVGVLVLDLDGFSSVNAGFGRSQGDAALTAFAQRIRRVAEGRCVARVGGDEFAVLMEAASREQAVDLARKMQRTIAAPLPIGSETLSQRSSVGIAVGDRRDRRPDGLVQDAATATRLARERGGDAVLVLDAETRRQLQEQTQLEANLGRAFNADALGVVFQPVVDLQERKIAGLEALTRWTDPEFGVVEPDQFIAIAERNGMIAPLTAWTLEAVCRQIASWRTAGVAVPSIAINVSTQLLLRADFPDNVLDALARAELPPSALILELSERSILDLPTEAADRLRALHQSGIRVVLDHFGAGSASLVHLRVLSVDGVKLDRSFIARLPADRHALAIVDAVVEMSRTLGIRAVATGVESPEQLEVITRVGCSTAQGFLFSPPLTADQVPEALANGVDFPSTEGNTMSLGAAAEALGLSVSTLRRRVDQGQLSSVRTPGGHRRIPRAQVEREVAIAQSRPVPRLPEAPLSPLPRISALFEERGAWFQHVAPRVVYAGPNHGWFQTPGGVQELRRWLAALAQSFKAGQLDGAIDATTTLLRAARSGNVTLPDRIALIDGVLNAAQAAAAKEAVPDDEMRNLRRARSVLRRHALEQADSSL